MLNTIGMVITIVSLVTPDTVDYHISGFRIA